MNTHTISIAESTLRLVIAAVLAGCVGWDREKKGRGAGLRTHMLVGIGSTLIMIVSAFGFEDILGHPDVVLDPSRIAAQVVSGIGFLGTGTILRKGSIKGLTTAAGLWSVAAIGLAVGGGMYVSAAIATIIVLIVLAGIRQLEQKTEKSKKKVSTIQFDADLVNTNILEIQAAIEKQGIKVENIAMRRTEIKEIQHITVTLGETGLPDSISKAVRDLTNGDSITNLSIQYNRTAGKDEDKEEEE